MLALQRAVPIPQHEIIVQRGLDFGGRSFGKAFSYGSHALALPFTLGVASWLKSVNFQEVIKRRPAYF